MIILCGKTASGKSVIQQELVELGLNPIVTYTTRDPRPDEINGVSYHFISDEEFKKKIEKDFFAEYTSYETVEGTKYYGSAMEDYLTPNLFKVAILNPGGLIQINKFKNLSNSKTFLIISDEETMWNRLRQRNGNSAEEARRRINADDKDFADINKYIDFAIRNDGTMNPKDIAELILQIYAKTVECEVIKT